MSTEPDGGAAGGRRDGEAERADHAKSTCERIEVVFSKDEDGQDEKTTITVIESKSSYSMVKIRKTIKNFVVDVVYDKERDRISKIIIMARKGEIYYIIRPNIDCAEFKHIADILADGRAKYFSPDDYGFTYKFLSKYNLKNCDDQVFVSDMLPEKYEEYEDYLKEKNVKIIYPYLEQDSDDEASDNGAVSERDIIDDSMEVYCSFVVDGYLKKDNIEENDSYSQNKYKHRRMDRRMRPAKSKEKRNHGPKGDADKIDIQIDDAEHADPNKKSKRSGKTKFGQREGVCKVLQDLKINKAILISTKDQNGEKVSNADVLNLMDELELSELNTEKVNGQEVYILPLHKRVNLDAVGKTTYVWYLIDLNEQAGTK